LNAPTLLAAACGLALAALAGTSTFPSTPPAQKAPMQLGNFSVSLTVKDISASKAFYEKLDFKEVGGKLEQNWVVLQNGTTTIGLFQGMFERNMLTFNPGWTPEKKALPEFQDVRELQKTLLERGLDLSTKADDSGTGPASFVLADPDGNPILFDQHVPKPKR
jgi:catechol 2,3-dioxygenase-like lactoylglutathione lyase family enzyme